VSDADDGVCWLLDAGIGDRVDANVVWGATDVGVSDAGDGVCWLLDAGSGTGGLISSPLLSFY
jgi:hypothetical protein